MKTVYRHPLIDEQRRIVAYFDSVQARLASLRELQSATGEELRLLFGSPSGVVTVHVGWRKNERG